MEDLSLKYDQIDGRGWITNKPDWIRVKRKSNGIVFIGFVDQFGKEMIPCKYVRQNQTGGYSFNNGLVALVNEEEKIGFVNEQGVEIIPCQFEKVSHIEDGLICCSKDVYGKNLYGLIDITGKVIVPFSYRFLGHMGKNRIIAQKNHSPVGALDYRGNVVIPFEYYQLGRVTTDDRIEYNKGLGMEHGFMDINGNIIEELPF